MTNAPENRKTHVIRILGTNKAGEVLQDIWADVERIDRAKNVLAGDESTWQGLERRLRWCDDPSSDDYEPDGNPARRIEIVKVCDPSEENLDDPEVWVAVPRIISLKSVTSHDNYQGQVERLLNEDIGESRIVEQRRIVHYDTNIDKYAQAAFDADPNLKVYVVPGDQYSRDESTKDDGQYVEHEIIKYLKHRGNSVNRGTSTNKLGQVGDQGRQTKLLNQYLIDDSAEAQLTEQGSEGFNPPYRLDPFQNIINVKFSGDVIVLINAAFYGESPASATYKLLKDNVRFLGATQVSYQAAGFPPPANSTWAFKVSADAGEFIAVRPAGTVIFADVYAIDLDLGLAGSLERAFAGAQLEQVGWWTAGIGTPTAGVFTHGSDLPGQVDPPGLLWSVLATASTGEETVLKIRRGKHRNDNLSTPSNTMVQLYPLGRPRTIGETLVSGYRLGTYRLDKKGTGNSYGIGGPIPSDDEFLPGINGYLVDPPWLQTVLSGFNILGIPYSDPPPLVESDHLSQGGGFVPPYGD